MNPRKSSAKFSYEIQATRLRDPDIQVTPSLLILPRQKGEKGGKIPLFSYALRDDPTDDDLFHKKQNHAKNGKLFKWILF